MRRRASLFPRQIVIASVLTAVAAGFLTSTLLRGSGEGRADRGQQVSTMGP